MKKSYKILFVIVLLCGGNVFGSDIIAGILSGTGDAIRDWQKRVSNNETFAPKVRALRGYYQAKNEASKAETACAEFQDLKKRRLEKEGFEYQQACARLKQERQKKLQELHSSDDNVAQEQEKKINNEFDRQQAILEKSNKEQSAQSLSELAQQERNLYKTRASAVQAQQEKWDDYVSIERPGAAHGAELAVRGGAAAWLYNKAKWCLRKTPTQSEGGTSLKTHASQYVRHLRSPVARGVLAVLIPSFMFESYIYQEFIQRDTEEYKKKLRESGVDNEVYVRVAGYEESLHQKYREKEAELEEQKETLAAKYAAEMQALTDEKAHYQEKLEADFDEEKREVYTKRDEIIAQKEQEHEKTMTDARRAYNKEMLELQDQLDQLRRDKDSLVSQYKTVEAKYQSATAQVENYEQGRGFWHRWMGKPWSKGTAKQDTTEEED